MRIESDDDNKHVFISPRSQDESNPANEYFIDL